MTKGKDKNIAASVRQRLLNRARSDKRPFHELLQYFAMERFLFRLSQSSHADKFVLKGALMLRVWQAPMMRPTMDIDMLARETSNEVAQIENQVRDICLIAVEPGDGLEFDVDSVQGEHITEDADYEGVRVRFIGRLDTARINMQIDIGFGDIVIPEAQQADLPAMLEFPPPRLTCYSLESAISEKFEAMIKLGKLNSRMKDFYDIWLLARQFDFNSRQLQAAISETLLNRGTKFPDEIIAFSGEFIDAKAIQWNAFRRRLGQEIVPTDFSEIIDLIKVFLVPIIKAIQTGNSASRTWIAPGPWQ